ncbi:LysR family transcriptional regulator [Acidisoma sp. 7E03]
MRASFDIEALRTMVVGSDLGSFARAAVQLGRSQSAVSMQLKRLEDQAGRPLFQRKGRGLIPTEAGETLLAYARRMVAIHDEAAMALGAPSALPAIRLGLPQDFFEDVMPAALAAFADVRPKAHVDVRAGRNYALEEEVTAGRLDVALAFAEPGRARSGVLLSLMPTLWFGPDRLSHGALAYPGDLPLVLFDSPCLFRQAALRSLDEAGIRWRLSLTTPSLSGIWAALRFDLGITVRTAHGVPPGIARLDHALPALGALELRMLTASDLSPVAMEFAEVLRATTERQISGGAEKQHPAVPKR